MTAILFLTGMSLWGQDTLNFGRLGYGFRTSALLAVNYSGQNKDYRTFVKNNSRRVNYGISSGFFLNLPTSSGKFSIALELNYQMIQRNNKYFTGMNDGLRGIHYTDSADYSAYTSYFQGVIIPVITIVGKPRINLKIGFFYTHEVHNHIRGQVIHNTSGVYAVKDSTSPGDYSYLVIQTSTLSKGSIIKQDPLNHIGLIAGIEVFLPMRFNNLGLEIRTDVFPSEISPTTKSREYQVSLGLNYWFNNRKATHPISAGN